MNIQKIEGFFDSSGKEENLEDKVMVVSGVLSEAAQWRDFESDWLKVLTDEQVPIGDVLPVFHTTDFHAKWGGYENTEFWTEEKRERLYNTLLDLINTHALYPVGIAILLDDYRRLRDENPALVLMYQKVGAFAASLAFWHCAQWSEKEDYHNSISYIFDLGETYRTEIDRIHRFACKIKGLRDFWRISKGELDFKDKEKFVPIQAADVIAWELAKDVKEELKRIDGTSRKPRPELEKLISPKTSFRFYEYKHLKWFWEQFAPFVLEEIKRLNEKENWFDSDFLDTFKNDYEKES